jgi:hypothetical protein
MKLRVFFLLAALGFAPALYAKNPQISEAG